MIKVIAFGASNSKNSINKKLAEFAANSLNNVEVKVLDLNHYEMPIYSIDKENINGIPQLAHDFKQELKASDGIIISFAEHNGAYTTAFKNIFDWISRIEKNVWYNKPMFLLATSPGGRGGATVLDLAVNKFQRMNSSPIVSFSLPSFNNNFDEENGIKDPALLSQFNSVKVQFQNNLKK